MLKQEKDILRKTVEWHKGLLSPADFINGICKRDEKSAHSLISKGFIEEVPHKLHDKDYIFYRASEKGRAVFYPIYKKVWLAVKGDIRTVIVAVIISIITTLVTIFIKSKL